ncbi:MAG: hypothetical protein EOP35_26515, partial [Rubrivivax sp.]
MSEGNGGRASEKVGFGQRMRAAFKGLRGRAERSSPSPDAAGEAGGATAQDLERQAAQLSERGEHAEALAVCRDGLKRYPGHVMLARIGASAAAKQHAWPLAAEWSAIVRVGRPTDKAGYMIGIRAARVAMQQGGSKDLLIALTREAETRFPNELWAGRASAQLALDLRDWTTALKIAERLQVAFPGQHDGYEMAILALFQMRRIDESETRLAEA